MKFMTIVYLFVTIWFAKPAPPPTPPGALPPRTFITFQWNGYKVTGYISSYVWIPSECRPHNCPYSYYVTFKLNGIWYHTVRYPGSFTVAVPQPH